MAFTFFFRDIQILEQVIAHAMPDFIGRSRIKIWDAGCALGQETYTLAILLAESMGRFSFKNIHIFATDIEENPQFGETVRQGIYNAEELQRIPEGLRVKYFEKTHKAHELRAIEILRERITYQKHDLLSLKPIGEDLSLVLCKNVLLHFQADERVEVIKMFHKNLSPSGYLAMEQTQKMPPEMEAMFHKIVPNGQVFKKISLPAESYNENTLVKLKRGEMLC
jgi:chemotaxis protein methyltransferase CheR